jgi:IS605 OrfB family transposase
LRTGLRKSHKIVELARQSQCAVAREDLTNLVEGLRELPRERGVGPLIPSYRRLEFWIGWQAEKLGVPVVVVEPRGTSSTCPKCGSRPAENGYRRMKCARCRL